MVIKLIIIKLNNENPLVFLFSSVSVLSEDILESSLIDGVLDVPELLEFVIGSIYNFTVIIIFLISIGLKEGLAQFAFWAGRKIKAKSLIADGWHHRSDAIASGLIIVGAVLGKYFWWIDGVLGIIIALMIFYVVYEIIIKAANKLLGETPSVELIEKIESIISDQSSTDIQPHHYHFHNYVNHKELTFHIKLDQEMSIMEGHKIATKIEDSIFDKLNLHTTIHIEPLSVKHRFD